MDILIILLVICISGVLYRIPRGGPNGEWAKEKFGISNLHGAVVWATVSSILFVLVTGQVWWAVPIVFLSMWLAEKPGYMDNIIHLNDGGFRINVKGFTLRGLYMLNPFMGLWYYLCEKYRHKLPVFGVYMDGWTAWAELACGLTIASFWILLLSVI